MSAHTPRGKVIASATIVESQHYEVISNTDLNEGRGREIVIGRVHGNHRAVADEMAAGRGVFGSDARVSLCVRRIVEWSEPGIRELRLNLLGDPIIICTEDPSRVKARYVASGLAKLTPEEKAALGLEEVSK